MLYFVLDLDPKLMRARRQALSLSQVDAANRAGIHASHWHHYESGERKNVRVRTLGRIAKALEVRPEKLLGEM